MQWSLFSQPCACGKPAAIAGRCLACYEQRRHSLRFFGGGREVVVERDRVCAVCHAAGEVVHHRIPGTEDPAMMIYLCRGCHAIVHHLRFIRYFLPARLCALWAEVHPNTPQQLQIDIAPE